MARLSNFIPQVQIDARLKAEDVTAAKLELADEIADYAQSIAPVDTGRYRDGIVVRRFDRGRVGVVFTDKKSHLIEYGTETNPEFAIRAKSIEHFRK